MAETPPPENAGVYANGRFYRYTPHFLERRSPPHPLGHPEATAERIRFVLENPQYTQAAGPRRSILWGRIQDPGINPWWLKVVVVENASGPAVLSAYKDDPIGGMK